MNTKVAVGLLECAIEAQYVGHHGMASQILGLLVQNLGIQLQTTNSVTSHELDIVQTNGKIEAIKAYRSRTGASLKESKDAIEAAMVKFNVHAAAPRY